MILSDTWSNIICKEVLDLLRPLRHLEYVIYNVYVIRNVSRIQNSIGKS